MILVQIELIGNATVCRSVNGYRIFVKYFLITKILLENGEQRAVGVFQSTVRLKSELFFIISL